jgi:hypothetical protein
MRQKIQSILGIFPRVTISSKDVLGQILLETLTESTAHKIPELASGGLTAAKENPYYQRPVHMCVGPKESGFSKRQKSCQGTARLERRA